MILQTTGFRSQDHIFQVYKATNHHLNNKPISIFYQHVNESTLNWLPKLINGAIIALAALVLMLPLILSSRLNKAQAEGSPMASSYSVSGMASSSSQSFKDLHAGKHHPFKQVDSSFRKIPPSRISNFSHQQFMFFNIQPLFYGNWPGWYVLLPGSTTRRRMKK